MPSFATSSCDIVDIWYRKDSLCFCRLPSLPPDIEAMPSHQHGVGQRIFVHRFCHSVGQVFFGRHIFNDRDDEHFVVTEKRIETKTRFGVRNLVIQLNDTFLCIIRSFLS